MPMRLFGILGGGGPGGIFGVSNDGSDVGTNLVRYFLDNPAFTNLRDLSFDLDAGYFFLVDTDGNDTNGIIRGNIADLFSATSTPTLTRIFETTGFGELLPGIEIDTVNHKIYWMDGSFDAGFELHRANYDGSGDELIATLDTENPDNFLGFPGGVADFVIDVAHNQAFILSTFAFIDGLGNASVLQNHVIRVNDLTAGSDNFTVLDVGDGDGSDGYVPGRLDPIYGQIAGMDIDRATGELYFVTQPVSQTDHGGIFKYNPATDTLTLLWEQPTPGTDSTLTDYPTGFMTFIEYDEVAHRYYVTTTSSADDEFDGTPGTNEADSSVYIGDPAGGAPERFIRIHGAGDTSGPLGLEIDYAADVALTGSGSTYTETAGAGSPAGPGVDVAGSFVLDDVDQATQWGATVAITGGFVSGDVLAVTTVGGVTASYNALTGVLTLSGQASEADYRTMLDSVTFANAGDNPTNFGANTSRTISFAVFDGLLYGNAATAVVNVADTADGPVNVTGGAIATSEDSVGVAVTGLSVSDVDSGTLTVTLSVAHGAIDILDSVGGGLSPGQISGNGTGSVTLTGSQSQINATLAAMGGVTYVPAADYNGADTLTMATSDGTLSDTDMVSITIAAVADIVGDNASTSEDNGVSIFVLGNDTFEGTPAITAVGAAAHGSVTINDNGTAGDTSDDYLVYTPGADYNGADSFTYTVTSGGVTETATVNVTVNAVADIVADMVSVNEDSGANALNLLANDTFENPGRYISAVTQGAHGTVAINDNGTAGDLTDDYVTYTPDADFAGMDSFTYTVTSGGVTETAIVNVNADGQNDAPVNHTGGAVAASEDASVAVTGLSVSDVDSSMLTVTLSVGRGTLAIDTGVGGGVTAGQVSGNGTGSVTLTGTQAQINATLAAATGVVYSPTANVNGADSLTMTSSDGGLSDTDNVAINVAAVNDAPLVVGDGTESAATIDQDEPSATGQSVSSLFAGQFSDATDQVAGGSSANAFAGIAVTANGSGVTGQWQYFNGAIWVNIGAASTGAAVLLDAATAIRFNPAPGFVGNAATLIAHLVDSSAGAIVSGALANLSVDGGTTPYSTGTVTLSQEVADINDAPTGVTGTLSVNEFPAANGGAVGTLVAQDPDSGTFTYTLINNAGGRFAMDSSGHVTVADRLLLDFEQQNVHTIRVQVDDNEGGVSQFDVNVSINDVHGENVTGDTRANTMVGGAESDTFSGANGNDILIGGGGTDYLFGDNGADRLDGGAGADVMTGGNDGDTFVFRKGQANGDIVQDFKGQGSGGDSIELIGYAAGTTFTRIGNGSSDVYQINDHGVIETVTIHGPGHVSATDVHFIL